MRDDVLIVLNEREPLKRQRAGELEQQLADRARSVARLAPQEELAKIIRERNPKVLLADYLLGDYGTILDVLPELDDTEVSTILWTDEPSLHAAITAMKHGAKDFIEITAPRSISRVLTAIDAALTETKPHPGTDRRVKQPSSTKLTADSAAMKLLKTELDGLARRNPPIALILGERGSGRNQIARYIHERRNKSGAFIELDADLYSGTTEELFGGENLRPGLLSSAATVFIDHAEFAPEEILSGAERRCSEANEPSSAPTSLLLGTSSRNFADAFMRLFKDYPVLQVPPLRERAEDVIPIIRSSIEQLPSAARINEPDWNGTLIHLLLSFLWPGNIRQFKGCIINAVSSETKLLEAHHDFPQLPTGTSTDELNRQQVNFLRLVLLEKARWERHSVSYERKPSILETLRVLDSTRGNRRLAAALLGTSVGILNGVLDRRNHLSEAEHES